MSFAVYIHWPFCQSKCPYCDFNSHVAASIDHAAWREAYAREIDFYADQLPDRTITSIFFGGGTPSLMEAKTVETVLQHIERRWRFDPDIEITLEANPTSVEVQKFIDFRRAGINRLSLGVQSLRDEDLKFLGRAHDADQAQRAIALARQHFPRFSFDLIYARRNQTPASWEQELREALKLADGHLSLYQLTIEPNTQFHTLFQRGENLTAADDHASVMYELTQDILAEAGLPAYEISNHAKTGQESRHNLTYWHYEDYIGVGPGAHGRVRGQGLEARGWGKEAHTRSNRFATMNHRSPEVWMKAVHEKSHGLKTFEPIDNLTAQREALMMGLRLKKGIAFDDWQKKFGSRLLDFIPTDKRDRLEKEGYLTTTGENISATSAGLQRLNAVLDYVLN